ncbi:MAG: leucyl/phenylalanyl-tRNA--protein transferase [Anaerolineae bacterium]|nr:leucyl/phenylalanyl-tRNA--protein transferase [Anaerolineae bacterium]
MKLTPQILLNAYSQGIFPMTGEDGAVYWYDPDPRAILPLDKFHVPRSLARRMRRGDFEVRVDTAFTPVMRACAEPVPGHPDREKTWISAEFIEVYSELHRLGYAHSVETWIKNELAGGLYGVSVRGLFAGESMFSRITDSSKIALVHLVQRLRQGGFCLLDVQFMTPHLRRFGAIEILRVEYKVRLAHALTVDAQF